MGRSAKQLLQHLGRRRSGAAVTSPPRPMDVASVPEPPVARYDQLPVDAVLARLGELAPRELATLAHHERTHRNRLVVLADIDARLGHEPWPGYDDLDVDGVRFGLEGAHEDRFVTVLAYERVHRNRAGVVLAAQQRR